MTIAPKLHHYLDALEADYELIEHAPTRIGHAECPDLPHIA